MTAINNTIQLYKLKESDLIIRSSIFKNNILNNNENGTILDCIDSNVVIAQSSLMNNSNNAYGGTIYFKSNLKSKHLLLESGSIISNNFAKSGGGLAYFSPNQIEFYDSMIFWNHGEIKGFYEYI